MKPKTIAAIIAVGVMVLMTALLLAVAKCANADVYLNSGPRDNVYIDETGQRWREDRYSSSGKIFDYDSRMRTEGTLYPSFRKADAGQKILYRIPVANGKHEVKLHFYTEKKRVLTVTAENKIRITDLDIERAVGLFKPLVKKIEVVVTDRKLNLEFTSSIGGPIISGIEVIEHPILAPKDPIVTMPECRLAWQSTNNIPNVQHKITLKSKDEKREIYVGDVKSVDCKQIGFEFKTYEITVSAIDGGAESQPSAPLITTMYPVELEQKYIVSAEPLKLTRPIHDQNKQTKTEQIPIGAICGDLLATENISDDIQYRTVVNENGVKGYAPCVKVE